MPVAKTEDVKDAETLATAGASNEEQIEMAAAHYAEAPDLSDAIVAGSPAADAALEAIVKPLIGAARPAPQTVQQLATRFDGIPTPGAAVHVFPTPQPS